MGNTLRLVYGPHHAKTLPRTYAKSEGPDQSAHPCSQDTKKKRRKALAQTTHPPRPSWTFTAPIYLEETFFPCRGSDNISSYMYTKMPL